MKARDCLCGHHWAAHGWRWQDDLGCATCPCTGYVPRRRRRWWGGPR